MILYINQHKNFLAVTHNTVMELPTMKPHFKPVKNPFFLVLCSAELY